MRNGEQTRITRVLDPVTLQCAQIIGISQFTAQLFKQVPVTLLPFMPNLLFQVTPEVGSNVVVIKEGVVYIKEKDDIVAGHQRYSLRYAGVLVPYSLLSFKKCCVPP